MTSPHSSQQRPGYRSDDVLEAAARELVQSMPDINGDIESHVAAIAKVLKEGSPTFDGYRLARSLEESYGWDADMDLAQSLDAASVIVGALVREATARWVAANSIRPKKAIGDMVSVETRNNEGRRGTYTGEIVAIDEAHAAYTVMIEALGHVREGTGTHGIIVPYETLHELADPPEEFVLTGV
jgi:hypothetical protein